jgi:prepilin-type N-terminal cleavage/methylation domain-containing protein
MKLTKNSRTGGFTLVEIMIVVAIIGLLAAIAIPNFVKARQTAQTNACINNLRVIDGAMQQWGLETGQKTTAVPTASVLLVYLGHGTTSKFPTCPLGGAYVMTTLAAPPTCPNASPDNTGPHYAVLN